MIESITRGEKFLVCSVPVCTVEYLKSRLTYNPATGELYWIKRGVFGSVRRAGSIDPSGHLILQIDGKNYRSARVAWALHYGEWPPLDRCVDHKDRSPLNDKIDNLRLATVQQNSVNSSHRKTQLSGAKGVVKKNNKWHANIYPNGERIRIGKFDSIEAAAEAYKNAAKVHYGEFAYGCSVNVSNN